MKHVHHWQLVWVLAMGIHDCEGWLPCVFACRCACGLSGVWQGEESSTLQQRRVHAGEHP